MVRTLGGIVAGMAVAVTIMMITELIGNQIAPAPARLDLTDIAEVPALPLLTLIFPVLGWFLGALAGGFVAIRISSVRWTAWVVAGAVVAATVFNFALMPYPALIIAMGLILPLIGGWLARRYSRPAAGDR